MLIEWLLRLFSRPKKYRYEYVDDVPEKISTYVIYIVLNEGFAWQILLECPCGCGEAINLSLLKDSEEHWCITLNRDNSISVKPSIHRTVGCKSHFFITDGKIEWCK